MKILQVSWSTCIKNLKSVEDKTWNIFNVKIHGKSISILEERKEEIYYYPELGISNEKWGGQNLKYFQI